MSKLEKFFKNKKKIDFIFFSENIQIQALKIVSESFLKIKI